MTPLADVLFQLLIFFMLSSNIVPYSMLTLRSGALEGGDAATEETETRALATDASATAVWTLHPDGLVAGGQRFALDRLPSLADALAVQGTRNVLIVIGSDVHVQQVTTVLETLAAHGIESVQIANGGTK
ncbi:biopolymer transporter ExbD [Paracoccus methylarcula]